MNQYKNQFEDLFKSENLHHFQKIHNNFQSLSSKVEEIQEISIIFVFLGSLLSSVCIPTYLLTYEVTPLNLTIFLSVFSFITIFLAYQLINLFKEKETFLLLKIKNYSEFLLVKKIYLQEREKIKFIFNNQENQYLIYCYFEELEPSLNPNYSITSELKCLKDNIDNNNVNNIIDITLKIQSIVLAEKNSLENKLINFKQHYEYY